MQPGSYVCVCLCVRACVCVLGVGGWGSGSGGLGWCVCARVCLRVRARLWASVKGTCGAKCRSRPRFPAAATRTPVLAVVLLHSSSDVYRDLTSRLLLGTVVKGPRQAPALLFYASPPPNSLYWNRNYSPSSQTKVWLQGPSWGHSRLLRQALYSRVFAHVCGKDEVEVFHNAENVPMNFLADFTRVLLRMRMC